MTGPSSRLVRRDEGSEDAPRGERFRTIAQVSYLLPRRGRACSPKIDRASLPKWGVVTPSNAGVRAIDARGEKATEARHRKATVSLHVSIATTFPLGPHVQRSP